MYAISRYCSIVVTHLKEFSQLLTDYYNIWKGSGECKMFWKTVSTEKRREVEDKGTNTTDEVSHSSSSSFSLLSSTTIAQFDKGFDLSNEEYDSENDAKFPTDLIVDGHPRETSQYIIPYLFRKVPLLQALLATKAGMWAGTAFQILTSTLNKIL